MFNRSIHKVIRYLSDSVPMKIYKKSYIGIYLI